MSVYFNDIKVLLITRFSYDHGMIKAPHGHRDFYQLTYCLEGTCKTVLNNNEYHVSSPSVIFTPPRVIHGLSDFGIKGIRTIDIKFMIMELSRIYYTKKTVN
jgi:quercetin dioxygenase-like cupin family protein